MLGRTQIIRLTCWLLLAFLGVGAREGLKAQESQVGLRVGVARSGFTGSGSDVWGPTTGFVVGAFAAVPLHGRLAMLLEASLTQKGSLRVDTATNIEWTTRLRPLYLEIPVLSRIRMLGQPHHFNLAIMAGLSAAFNLSCEETNIPRLLSGTGPLPQSSRYGCNRRLTFPESPEFNVIGGLAASGLLSQLPVEIDIRFVHGLFDIGESTYQRGTNFPEFRNVTLALSLGVILRRTH